MNERLTERLAAIAAEMDRLTKVQVDPIALTFLVHFFTPDSHSWLLAPAKLEQLKHKLDPLLGVNVEFNILNFESLKRFIEGSANPQVETLNGDWQFKGLAADIMVFSQCIFTKHGDL